MNKRLRAEQSDPQNEKDGAVRVMILHMDEDCFLRYVVDIKNPKALEHLNKDANFDTAIPNLAQEEDPLFNKDIDPVEYLDQDDLEEYHTACKDIAKEEELSQEEQDKEFLQRARQFVNEIRQGSAYHHRAARGRAWLDKRNLVQKKEERQTNHMSSGDFAWCYEHPVDRVYCLSFDL